MGSIDRPEHIWLYKVNAQANRHWSAGCDSAAAGTMVQRVNKQRDA